MSNWPVADYCKTGWISASIPGFGDTAPLGWPCNYVWIVYLDGVPLCTNWGSLSNCTDWNSISVGQNTLNVISNDCAWPLCYTGGSNSWVFALSMIGDGVNQSDGTDIQSGNGRTLRYGGIQTNILFQNQVQNPALPNNPLLVILVVIALIIFVFWLGITIVQHIYKQYSQPKPDKDPGNDP